VSRLRTLAHLKLDYISRFGPKITS